MVHAVHRERRGPHQPTQARSLREVHFVRQFVAPPTADGIVVVLDRGGMLRRHVLIQRAPDRDIDELRAATDREHGFRSASAHRRNSSSVQSRAGSVRPHSGPRGSP